MEKLKNKNLFNFYFNEEGEEQQQEADPNAQPQEQPQPQGDPNAQQPAQGQPPQPNLQQPAILPELEPDDDNEDDDDKDSFEKKFPMENDGQTTEQDILNFTNFQKLNYFKKFKSLINLTKKMELQIEKSKQSIVFDEMDDEKQQLVIDTLIHAIFDIRKQTKFFIEKGIAAVNIDKTRCIFRTQIRKLNYIIDKFEMIMNQGKED